MDELHDILQITWKIQGILQRTMSTPTIPKLVMLCHFDL